MLRKIHLASLILLAFSSPTLGAGFYVGAGVGPDHADFGLNSHVTLPGSFDVISKTHLSGLGVFGSLFAGYGWNYRRLSLAGEINADLNSIESKTSNSEFIHQSFASSNFKISPVFGISLLPGYIFSKTTLFYTRFGYSDADFKISTSDVSLKNINQYVSGFRFGAGMKEALTRNLSVRIEYSQVRYSDPSFTTVDPLSGVTDTSSFRPQTQQVEFGLVYNFV